MHIVGFIIRIFHDARSTERQIRKIINIACSLTVTIADTPSARSITSTINLAKTYKFLL